MPKAGDAQALKPGTQLDVYDIEKVLGTGGFGITYQAHDTTLACAVAVKEFFPSHLACRADDGTTLTARGTEHERAYRTGMRRFLEEARTLARFKEPGIVRVSRLFEANGTAYLVMDYVEGISLEMRLRRHGVLDETTATTMLPPLLDGLRALHAQHILHRDIKPANIYVKDDGSPVLLDFGAAREAVEGENSAMTLIVTPGYAPMEQYTRDERQGPWSDLYALGATLFHCLVGHPPMAAPDRFTRRVEGRPDPVGHMLRSLQTPMSEAFLAVLEKLLAVSIAERPKNAQEVLDQMHTLNTVAGDSMMLDLRGSRVPTRPARSPRSGPASGAPVYSEVPSNDSVLLGPVPTSAAARSQLERVALRAGGVLAQRAVATAMQRALTGEQVIETIASFITDADQRDEFRRHARVVLKTAVRGSQEVTAGVPASSLPSQVPRADPRDTPTVLAPSSRSPVTSGDTSGGRTIDEGFARELETRLAETLGPIAGMLVRRAAQRAASHSELVALLAAELDDPQERADFTRGLL